MIEALKAGALLGLTLSVLIGPVFFALLQTSIHRGFQAGIMLAIGIAISDSLYISITNFFIVSIPKELNLEFWLALVSGAILVLIGVRSLFSRLKPLKKDLLDKKSHEILDDELGEETARHSKPPEWQKWFRLARLVGKGFLLNALHPGVLLFWIWVVGFISVNFNYSLNEKLSLYGTTISIVFITDIWKAFLASRIRRFLTSKVMLWTNRLMGAVLIGFGVQLLLRATGVL